MTAQGLKTLWVDKLYLSADAGINPVTNNGKTWNLYLISHPLKSCVAYSYSLDCYNPYETALLEPPNKTLIHRIENQDPTNQDSLCFSLDDLLKVVGKNDQQTPQMVVKNGDVPFTMVKITILTMVI